MKKLHFTFAAIFLLAGSLFAKTITVSNNSNSPGQYNNLQTAINAATAGDTILVSGSGASYGSISIDRKLTILGQGYDPRKDLPFPSTVDGFSLFGGSSGTTISGFLVSSISYSNYYDSLKNIVIKRNKVQTIYTSSNSSNWLISENIITTYIVIYGGAGFIIKDNIFTYNYTGDILISAPSTTTNLIISNNHFTGQNYLDVYNAIISNNIFSYKSSTANSFAFLRTGSSGNNSISKNITYKNPNTNPFMIGQNGNTGAGNLVNTDPKLVSYDLSTTDLLSTDNLQLLAGSPAKNAGTDGKDIGVHGGSTPMQYPYSGEPAIPQIKTMNINNTTIAPGGSLNVQLKANSNN